MNGHLHIQPALNAVECSNPSQKRGTEDDDGVMIIASGGPGMPEGDGPAGSRRVGGEAWFAQARDHMDEVRIFFHPFFDWIPLELKVSKHEVWGDGRISTSKRSHGRGTIPFHPFFMPTKPKAKQPDKFRIRVLAFKFSDQKT
jgi:hypothetical protein